MRWWGVLGVILCWRALVKTARTAAKSQPSNPLRHIMSMMPTAAADISICLRRRSCKSNDDRRARVMIVLQWGCDHVQAQSWCCCSAK